MEKKKPIKIPSYLTPDQIKRIENEIKDIKDMLNGSDELKRSDVGYFKHASSHLNVDDCKEAIKGREQKLKALSPKKLTGEKANKAYSYAKNLKEWIIKNMPRETYAMYPRSKDSVVKAADFERVVNEQVAWQMNGGDQKIAMYNALIRRIDPDAPTFDFNKLVRERA